MGGVESISFPIGVGVQSFDSWSKTLDKYKDKINKDTIFIGRSIGPIFIIKYLLENNLKIDKLIAVSGFNNCYIDHGEYDSVNKSMYVKDITLIKSHVNKVISIISENDPYVKFSSLTSFANKIADVIVNIRDGGHFNTDSGYGKKFEDLLYYATKK